MFIENFEDMKLIIYFYIELSILLKSHLKLIIVKDIMIVEFPSHFGYILLSVAYSAIMNIYFFVTVYKARLDYKVNYPNLYADKKFEGERNAYKFNCI